jgi:hypothetical protein
MDEDTPESSSELKQQASGFDPVTFEPFVKPDSVAEYLGIDPGTVVRFARVGVIPGHPLRVSGRRTHWRFLLSEIRSAMLAKKPKEVRHARADLQP